MANTRKHLAAAMSIVLSMGLAACEQKGPVEQAGEEVDEAVDTLKNDGQESTATKLDDAADELREGVNDAGDEVRSK